VQASFDEYVKSDKIGSFFFSIHVYNHLKINIQFEAFVFFLFFSKLFSEIKRNNSLRETDLL